MLNSGYPKLGRPEKLTMQGRPDYREQDILTGNPQDVSDIIASQNDTTACLLLVYGTNQECCRTPLRDPN
ncbi:hypothetical protein T265_12160 [Opisthorchis viverrini]|uniref:Uncharacterized protein n=1 Tax=Opisthorchis viverrini TaxID=6198 RepID=A0A074YVT1_OPIVI|nr:hypothetical protein T265_12160 [Opisthorchis viverrini]KER18778.1 hypothetical protein T265_12160 [Opisthorchis viverrini]